MTLRTMLGITAAVAALALGAAGHAAAIPYPEPTVVDPDDYNGKGVEWADSGQGKSQEEIMADMRAFQEVLAGQSSQVFVPNQDASMPVTDDIWSDAHNADFF